MDYEVIDRFVKDEEALDEACWRATRGELTEALIMLVRAIPDLHNLLKLAEKVR